MDSIISLQGRDFTLSAADVTAARSIVVMKHSQDKVLALDSRKTLSMAGEVGDAAQFTEYVQRNIHLYELRVGVPMSTKEAAHYIRGELARFLRQSPFAVNLVLCGVDPAAGGGAPVPSVYFIDYMGSLHRMSYAAQGYCSYFVLSTLDRLYRPGMSEAEAMDVMQHCIAELSERFLLQQRQFVFKVADKNGVRVLPSSAETYA